MTDAQRDDECPHCRSIGMSAAFDKYTARCTHPRQDPAEVPHGPVIRALRVRDFKPVSFGLREMP